MRRERLQNHISGSEFTLPVCGCVAVASFACHCGSWDSPMVWIAAVLLLLTAYVLIETNNRNQLLRVRSRMVSSVWLVLVAAMPDLQCYSVGMTSALLVALAYFILFRTYQDYDCQLSTFHWALMIGLSSLFVPQLLCCLPLFLWHQTVFLRSMSLRNLCAALVGCGFPLMMYYIYVYFAGSQPPFLHWNTDRLLWQHIEWSNYLVLTLPQRLQWGLVSLLTLIGIIHFLDTYYNDKIRVRMFYYILCMQFVVFETLVALQPQYIDTFMPLLAVTGAPFIAHYFALTSSWFTNGIFVLSVAATVALGYFNF